MRSATIAASAATASTRATATMLSTWAMRLLSAWTARLLSAWATGLSAWSTGLLSPWRAGCCGRRLRRAISIHVVDRLVVELVPFGSGRAIAPVAILRVRRVLRSLARMVIALRLPAVTRGTRRAHSRRLQQGAELPAFELLYLPALELRRHGDDAVTRAYQTAHG